MDSKDVGDTGPVDGWLEVAIATLDDRFGAGYAAMNPSLVGAYIQACALASIRTALTDELVNALAGVERAAGRAG